MNHNIEIRDALLSYAAMGPSESNDNIVQGAAEEPVAEGAISRPTSQASIHSNEVSSKPTIRMVTREHPIGILAWQNISTIDPTGKTPRQGLTKVGTMRHHFIGSMQGDQHADCQLPGEGAARDDRHRVLKDTKAQVDTNHQPPPRHHPVPCP